MMRSTATGDILSNSLLCCIDISAHSEPVWTFNRKLYTCIKTWPKKLKKINSITFFYSYFPCTSSFILRKSLRSWHLWIIPCAIRFLASPGQGGSSYRRKAQGAWISFGIGDPITNSHGFWMERASDLLQMQRGEKQNNRKGQKTLD